MRVHKLDHGVSVLNTHLPVPGLGFLAVNGFVLHGEQPVVVDTGLSVPDNGFMDALATVIDPADVRWIYLTHPDRDHTGSIFDLLAAAPRARVITTFAGAGIMTAERPLPIDRLYLLNPGETLNIGDRNITVFRPPLYDSPATTGFYEDAGGVCFSSDCFGALLPTEDNAATDDIASIAGDDLRAGQLLWATADSPWVHNVDPQRFQNTLDPIRGFDPSMILSAHLPPAHGHTNAFLDLVAAAPHARAFIGPDQKALEQMLGSFEP